MAPAVMQLYNAGRHITMHNTQRQFCYSTSASRPISQLRCGHKKVRGISFTPAQTQWNWYTQI